MEGINDRASCIVEVHFLKQKCPFKNCILYELHLFENDLYAILPELYLIVSTLVLLLGYLQYVKKHHTPSLMQPSLGFFSLFCTFCILQNLPFSPMTFFYTTYYGPFKFFF